tara:strand:- start:3947 stop:5149 length:1203 start_codon:yes stop_codon:yes gene_type:complete
MGHGLDVKCGAVSVDEESGFSTPTTDVDFSENRSDYELKRLENMRRNTDFLRDLGLVQGHAPGRRNRKRARGWDAIAIGPDGRQGGEQCTLDPPDVSGPVSRPPAASKDGETSGGDGGCTASALSAIGVFPSMSAIPPPASATVGRPPPLPEALSVASSPGNEAPEVDPSTFSEGGGVTEDGVCRERKRSREEWELLRQEEKRARKTGAIIAPSRTAEGYTLPSGNQKTCTPDALYNGLLAFRFEGASLARLRTLSIPKLGLDPMASWKSVSSALSTLGYPFVIEEATSRFKGKGGPMLNLLRSQERGVYLVALLVTVDGVRNKHCVMLSTLREKHAPSGKLIDNHGKMRPVYLEKKDTNGKDSAKKAWKVFVGQNPAVKGRSFTVEPADVYELKRTAMA